jgi:hypothetical protein
MPFGKHKDQDLTEIPKSYLCWLRRQEWLGEWLAKETDSVLSGDADKSFEEVLEELRKSENE